MLLRRERYTILNYHVLREFLLNFIVSFIFFFFIFFVNQILLLVKKVMLKNVDIFMMLQLVMCAIPQFLQYVIPFATLSASSMVLGDLGANNELLALRSLGIPMKKVYKVLIILSLVLTLLTFYISDYLMPQSQKVYKSLLNNIMRELPTFELKENGTNTVGDIVLVNKEVEGNKINDILLFNNSANPEQTISASSGTLELIDLDRYIYKLDLNDTKLLLSEKDISSWSLATSENTTLFLNFSDQIPALTQDSPSNLSNKDLAVLINESKEDLIESRKRFHNNRSEILTSIASNLSDVDSYENYLQVKRNIESKVTELDIYGDKEPIGFYYQYYTAEWHKKYVLSFACFCLTVVTFPLSFIKIKYGRLFGFGLSLLVAVLYWYILFFSQLKIFDVTFSSSYLMWICDGVMLLLGGVLLLLKRK
ncbi:LptF/LptG family permease [Bullifex sp.]|uniref:LptF/LptG family permease n=1 Tax=Bullifex sp. TaxID=2815808 RepID=UPI002A833F32|nr:LptF/LptG family permease [Bullifex sp.]MDY4068082.1 LptF/LptG family permease [Bullifex sp.]